MLRRAQLWQGFEDGHEHTCGQEESEYLYSVTLFITIQCPYGLSLVQWISLKGLDTHRERDAGEYILLRHHIINQAPVFPLILKRGTQCHRLIQVGQLNADFLRSISVYQKGQQHHVLPRKRGKASSEEQEQVEGAVQKGQINQSDKYSPHCSGRELHFLGMQ